MPVIFRMLDTTVHWQSRVNALNLITIAVDEAPAETAACLPDIIPGLTPCMTDTKKEVKSASKDAMKKALSVAGESGAQRTQHHPLARQPTHRRSSSRSPTRRSATRCKP